MRRAQIRGQPKATESIESESNTQRGLYVYIRVQSTKWWFQLNEDRTANIKKNTEKKKQKIATG